ncbi:unnamed protein product [Ambrosiozyma monospora]|uniref:Unnamed protein product n=1 Tax=Ambrosiozyma monospora TaxID=43982 RepID=A0ACB5UBC8_AMBMO|nr:unnamed protein product [Ambrosiozyma monospora]
MFQDYYPLLMASQESYNAVLDDVGTDGNYVMVESFRPNLILKNVARPFDEEFYLKFDIVSTDTEKTGSYRYHFSTSMKCARCTIPNIDPKTGVPDKKATVSKKMAKYRRTDDGSPYSCIFGVYTVNHDVGITIKQGDKVDLLLRASKHLLPKDDPFH